MGNQVRVGVGVTGAKGAASELDGLRDKFDKLQKQGAKGFAVGAGAAVAVGGLNLLGNALGGVIGFGADAIKSASDLNETLGKSGVVFGDQASAVEKWGETTAQAFGLSKQASIEAAASFGNVFKGLGFASQKSAEMSERLVALAGDLASFNNIDPTEALDKLRSGLAGEAEPLRSVGVFLTEAAVKAEAAKEGLGNAHGELTEGEKIIARYNLILKQTTTAQGDFARTSEGLANSQRKANGMLADTSAELGERLIPIQQTGTGVLLNLVKGVNVLGDALGHKVTPELLSANVNMLGLADATSFAHNNINTMSAESLDAAQALGLLTDSEVKAAKEANGLVHHFSDTSNHAGKMADDIARVADDVKPPIKAIVQAIGSIGGKAIKTENQVRRALSGVIDDLKSAEGDAQSAGQDFADALFDPVIEKADLMANRREQSETRAAIKSGKIHGKELADAKAHLTELKKTETEILVSLAETGDKSAASQLLAMAKTTLASKTASREQRAAAQALIDKLNALAAAYRRVDAAAERLASARRDHTLDKPGQAPKPHAAGGSFGPNEVMLVGENGPEIVVGGSSGGEVIPNNKIGAGGGGGVTINVNLTAGLMTPGVKAQLERELAPMILSSLRQAGVRL